MEPELQQIVLIDMNNVLFNIMTKTSASQAYLEILDLVQESEISEDAAYDWLTMKLDWYRMASEEGEDYD